MSSNRTTQGVKKAALSGPLPLKQTKLSFGPLAPKPKKRTHDETTSDATESQQSEKENKIPRPTTDDSTEKRYQDKPRQEEDGRPSPERGSNPSRAKLHHPAAQQPNQETDDERPTAPTTTPPPPPPNPLPPADKGRSPNIFHLTEQQGDLFAAPPDSVLVHACNCNGSWGGGIALAFKKAYPGAYKVYHDHCKASKPDRLVGTALLIPPQTTGPASKTERQRRHFIGCLFTSNSIGRNVDPPDQILAATVPAMAGLVRNIAGLARRGKVVGEVRMCRINSVLFAVPWEDTRRAIRGMKLDDWDEDGRMGGALGGLPVDVVVWNR